MQSIRNFWTDPQRRRTAMWVTGALAVTALVVGMIIFLEAHLTYTELNHKAEVLGPPTDPTDASNALFAMMLRDRDKAENRRWQGVTLLGIGLVGLGIAYLFKPEETASAAGESTTAPGKSETRAADDNQVL